jgi:hypothetical protein
VHDYHREEKPLELNLERAAILEEAGVHVIYRLDAVLSNGCRQLKRYFVTLARKRKRELGGLDCR